MPAEKPNTLITYGYTDASNYKSTTAFIIEGVIGPEGARAIMDACKNEGDYLSFVPEAIGLPLERPGEYNDQDDHPWANFSIDPELNFEPTGLPPTSTLTVSDIMLKFVIAKDKWDDLAATQTAINEGTQLPQTAIKTTSNKNTECPELTAFDNLTTLLNDSSSIPASVKSVIRERMKGIRSLIVYGIYGKK